MKWLLAGLLALILGGLYFFTMPPDVYLEDSGELVAAVHFLGIAHPSGYPLYLLLGKLFTFLPAGTIAFRLNLMSAVFGIATAVVLFAVLRELQKILQKDSPRSSDLLAWVLALVFGISRDFWSQAVVAEVYSLNSFLAGLLFYFFLRWWQAPHRRRYLWILAFLSGLGVTNHVIFALLLPILWVAVFASFEGHMAARDAGIWRLVFLFGLGISVYLYIPLRAAADPVMNFNRVSSLSDSFNHILRAYYADVDAGFANKWRFLSAFGQGVIGNFTVFMVAAALGGAAVLLNRRQYAFLGLLVGEALFSVAPLIFLRGVAYSENAAFTYRVYYFQAYLFVIMLAFVFLNYLSAGKKLVVGGLILLAAVMIVRNFPLLNLRTSQVADYYEAKLQSFPPNSIYILAGEGYDYDSELFIFLYFQKVRNLRPDVRIVDFSRIFYLPPEDFDTSDLKTLAAVRTKYLEHAAALEAVAAANPVYASFPVEAYAKDLISRPNGYAVTVLPKDENNSASPPLFPPHLSSPTKGGGIPFSDFPPPGGEELKEGGSREDEDVFLRHPRQVWDLAYQDFLAASFYARAAFEKLQGEPSTAAKHLLDAIKFDNETPEAEDLRAFEAFRASH